MWKQLIPVQLFACRGIHDVSEVPRVQRRLTQEPWKNKVNDFGYHFNRMKTGHKLPRMKDEMEPVTGYDPPNLDPPTKKKIDNWSEEEATLGQNDYIDILGDGSIHPSQLLYHHPAWLRGFPGQHKANEIVRLIHYRNMYKHNMMEHCPKRWHELIKQIQYLMKYNNYYKADEIKWERNLGLWEEEPDYYYKNKERRSYLDIP